MSGGTDVAELGASAGVAVVGAPIALALFGEVVLGGTLGAVGGGVGHAGDTVGVFGVALFAGEVGGEVVFLGADVAGAGGGLSAGVDFGVVGGVVGGCVVGGGGVCGGVGVGGAVVVGRIGG